MRKSIVQAVILSFLAVTYGFGQELKSSQLSLGTSSFINSRRLITLGESPSLTTIQARGEPLDPKTRQRPDGTTVARAASSMAPADTLRLVQLPGGLDDATARALSTSGMRIIGYIQHNTFIVAVPAARLKALQALPAARWVGDYEPAYRLSDELQDVVRGLSNPQADINVKAAFLRDTRLADCVNAVAALGTVRSTETTLSEHVVEVTLPASRLNDLASLPWVVVIENAPLDTFHNNIVTGIIEVRTLWTNRMLMGSNEIVAVADSGIDIGTNASEVIHADFQDGAGNSRLLWTQDYSGDGVQDNGSGHGTHVAGIVLGNGFMSGSDPTNNYFPDTCYAGVAPKAGLIFQALGRSNDTVGTTVYLPTDTAELFQGAYTNGARIHQDSWGSAVSGRYDARCREIDRWNYENPYMLICFSAQNSGRDTTPRNGIVDSNSMQRPATCKNVLSVGATESYRMDITNDYAWYSSANFPSNPIRNDLMANAPTGMAAMSSRGQCADGRIKPDLVAPGTWIISTHSHEIHRTNTLWGVLPGNTNYCYGGGASMATPLVSGAAALLREYLRNQHGMTNPSAPLLKALLINGAIDISPGQYDADHRETYEVPNSVQGWGRARLDGSLFGPAGYQVYFNDGATNPIMGPCNTGLTFQVVDTNFPVKVHLTWLDIEASRHTVNWTWSSIVGGGIVNDLDLRVIGPGSEVYQPRAANTLVDLYYYRSNDVYGYYSDSAGLNLYLAQQCTAPELPLTVNRIFYMINDTVGKASNLTLYVWAGGNSSNDPPGAMLSQTNVVVGGAFGLLYYTVPLPTPVVITSRYFFVGCKQATTNICLCYDPSNAVSARAYATFDTNNWAAGRALNGDFWIHAMGTAPSNDHVNNIEGIVITNPALGTYQVVIDAINVPYPPVRYGLVISGGLAPVSAVVLYDFYLHAENGIVQACWQTASETDTLGFDLYREESGAWVKVNSTMVPAQGWPQGGIGASYCVADAGARADGTYRYKLVEYDTTGAVLEYGPFERSVWTPRLSNFTATPTGMMIQWLSRAGAAYDVLKAQDARGPYAPAALDLPATPPVNTWIDPAPSVGAAFYRIETK